MSNELIIITSSDDEEDISTLQHSTVQRNMAKTNQQCYRNHLPTCESASASIIPHRGSSNLRSLPVSRASVMAIPTDQRLNAGSPSVLSTSTRSLIFANTASSPVSQSSSVQQTTLEKSLDKPMHGMASTFQRHSELTGPCNIQLPVKLAINGFGDRQPSAANNGILSQPPNGVARNRLSLNRVREASTTAIEEHDLSSDRRQTASPIIKATTPTVRSVENLSSQPVIPTTNVSIIVSSDEEEESQSVLLVGEFYDGRKRRRADAGDSIGCPTKRQRTAKDKYDSDISTDSDCMRSSRVKTAAESKNIAVTSDTNITTDSDIDNTQVDGFDTQSISLLSTSGQTVPQALINNSQPKMLLHAGDEIVADCSRSNLSEISSDGWLTQMIGDKTPTATTSVLVQSILTPLQINSKISVSSNLSNNPVCSQFVNTPAETVSCKPIVSAPCAQSFSTPVSLPIQRTSNSDVISHTRSGSKKLIAAKSLLKESSCSSSSSDDDNAQSTIKSPRARATPSVHAYLASHCMSLSDNLDSLTLPSSKKLLSGGALASGKDNSGTPGQSHCKVLETPVTSDSDHPSRAVNRLEIRGSVPDCEQQSVEHRFKTSVNCHNDENLALETATLSSVEDHSRTAADPLKKDNKVLEITVASIKDYSASEVHRLEHANNFRASAEQLLGMHSSSQVIHNSKHDQILKWPITASADNHPEDLDPLIESSSRESAKLKLPVSLKLSPDVNESDPMSSRDSPLKHLLTNCKVLLTPVALSPNMPKSPNMTKSLLQVSDNDTSGKRIESCLVVDDMPIRCDDLTDLLTNHVGLLKTSTNQPSHFGPDSSIPSLKDDDLQIHSEQSRSESHKCKHDSGHLKDNVSGSKLPKILDSPCSDAEDEDDNDDVLQGKWNAEKKPKKNTKRGTGAKRKQQFTHPGAEHDHKNKTSHAGVKRKNAGIKKQNITKRTERIFPLSSIFQTHSSSGSSSEDGEKQDCKTCRKNINGRLRAAGSQDSLFQTHTSSSSDDCNDPEHKAFPVSARMSYVSTSEHLVALDGLEKKREDTVPVLKDAKLQQICTVLLHDIKGSGMPEGSRKLSNYRYKLLPVSPVPKLSPPPLVRNLICDPESVQEESERNVKEKMLVSHSSSCEDLFGTTSMSESSDAEVPSERLIDGELHSISDQRRDRVGENISDDSSDELLSQQLNLAESNLVKSADETAFVSKDVHQNISDDSSDELLSQQLILAESNLGINVNEAAFAIKDTHQNISGDSSHELLSQQRNLAESNLGIDVNEAAFAIKDVLLASEAVVIQLPERLPSEAGDCLTSVTKCQQNQDECSSPSRAETTAVVNYSMQEDCITLDDDEDDDVIFFNLTQTVFKQEPVSGDEEGEKLFSDEDGDFWQTATFDENVMKALDRVDTELSKTCAAHVGDVPNLNECPDTTSDNVQVLRGLVKEPLIDEITKNVDRDTPRSPPGEKSNRNDKNDDGNDGEENDDGRKDGEFQADDNSDVKPKQQSEPKSYSFYKRKESDVSIDMPLSSSKAVVNMTVFNKESKHATKLDHFKVPLSNDMLDRSAAKIAYFCANPEQLNIELNIDKIIEGRVDKLKHASRLKNGTLTVKKSTTQSETTTDLQLNDSNRIESVVKIIDTVMSLDTTVSNKNGVPKDACYASEILPDAASAIIPRQDNWLNKHSLKQKRCRQNSNDASTEALVKPKSFREEQEAKIAVMNSKNVLETHRAHQKTKTFKKGTHLDKVSAESDLDVGIDRARRQMQERATAAIKDGRVTKDTSKENNNRQDTPSGMVSIKRSAVPSRTESANDKSLTSDTSINHNSKNDNILLSTEHVSSKKMRFTDSDNCEERSKTEKPEAGLGDSATATSLKSFKIPRRSRSPAIGDTLPKYPVKDGDGQISYCPRTLKIIEPIAQPRRRGNTTSSVQIQPGSDSSKANHIVRTDISDSTSRSCRGTETLEGSNTTCREMNVRKDSKSVEKNSHGNSSLPKGAKRDHSGLNKNEMPSSSDPAPKSNSRENMIQVSKTVSKGLATEVTGSGSTTIKLVNTKHHDESSAALSKKQNQSVECVESKNKLTATDCIELNRANSVVTNRARMDKKLEQRNLDPNLGSKASNAERSSTSSVSSLNFAVREDRSSKSKHTSHRSHTADDSASRSRGRSFSAGQRSHTENLTSNLHESRKKDGHAANKLSSSTFADHRHSSSHLKNTPAERATSAVNQKLPRKELPPNLNSKVAATFSRPDPRLVCSVDVNGETMLSSAVGCDDSGESGITRDRGHFGNKSDLRHSENFLVANKTQTLSALIAKDMTNIGTGACLPPAVAAMEVKPHVIPDVHLSKVNIQAVVMPGAHLKPATSDPSPAMCINKFISDILWWNASWLKEYHDARSSANRDPPPVLKDSKFFPLLETYDSYEDYLKIATPLLTVETWDAIYNDWVEENKNKPPHAVVVRNGHPDKDNQRIILHCQGLIQPNKPFLRTGDLIILNTRTPGRHASRIKSSAAAPGEKTSNDPPPGGDNQIVMVIKPVFGYILSASKLHRNASVEQLHPLIVNSRKKYPHCEVVQYQVQVFYRPQPIDNNDFINIELISSLVSTLRQMEALLYLHRCPLKRDILRPINKHCFFHDNPRDTAHLTSRFNVSQADAIARITGAILQPFQSPKICLLMGPPGTGKSHTVIGLIEQILLSRPTTTPQAGDKRRILLCAPSNAGIDELCRRLKSRNERVETKPEHRLRFVRFGNSISPDISAFSLQEQIKSQAATMRQMSGPKSVVTAIKELDSKIEKLRELRKNEHSLNQIGILESELSKLQKKKAAFKTDPEQPLSGKQEFEVKQKVLMSADIICTTLNASGQQTLLSILGPDKKSARCHFTCVIIDEACQCTETDTLVPLQYGVSKLVLVGDPEQLPPTVLSKKASAMNYGQSLFERFYTHFSQMSPSPVAMLETQYRMHPEICNFPSKHVYHERLKTDEKIAEQRNSFPFAHYSVFDLQYTEETSSGMSTINMKEAEFVKELCKFIIIQGSNGRTRKCPSIGIITPYQQQKTEINKLLEKSGLHHIEVNTVDGFQGREKDIIILSCVRANKTKNIGFLDDRRRLNVSLTRAKYALFVVGSMQTLKSSADWLALMNDANIRGRIIRVSSVEEIDKQIKTGCQRCQPQTNQSSTRSISTSRELSGRN